MSIRHIVIRLIMLIIVSATFISSFYFYYKNSRASSPLSDKEYIEQVRALRNRYNVAGEPIGDPTPTILPKKDNSNVFVTVLANIIAFFTNLMR